MNLLKEKVLGYYEYQNKEREIYADSSAGGIQKLLEGTQYKSLKFSLLNNKKYEIILWEYSQHTDVFSKVKELIPLTKDLICNLYIFKNFLKGDFDKPIHNIIQVSASNDIKNKKFVFFKEHSKNLSPYYSETVINKIKKFMPFAEWVIFFDKIADLENNKTYDGDFSKDDSNVFSFFYARDEFKDISPFRFDKKRIASNKEIENRNKMENKMAEKKSMFEQFSTLKESIPTATGEVLIKKGKGAILVACASGLIVVYEDGGFSDCITKYPDGSISSANPGKVPKDLWKAAEEFLNRPIVDKDKVVKVGNQFYQMESFLNNLENKLTGKYADDVNKLLEIKGAIGETKQLFNTILEYTDKEEDVIDKQNADEKEKEEYGKPKKTPPPQKADGGKDGNTLVDEEEEKKKLLYTAEEEEKKKAERKEVDYINTTANKIYEYHKKEMAKTDLNAVKEFIYDLKEQLIKDKVLPVYKIESIISNLNFTEKVSYKPEVLKENIKYLKKSDEIFAFLEKVIETTRKTQIAIYNRSSGMLSFGTNYVDLAKKGQSFVCNDEHSDFQIEIPINIAHSLRYEIEPEWSKPNSYNKFVIELNDGIEFSFGFFTKG